MNLGIYIQVPFCQTKCTYCNFHTGVASPAAYAPYARAVEREIRDWRALHAAAKLDSAAHLGSGDIADSCHPEGVRLGRMTEGSAFAPNVAPGFVPASASQLDTIYLGGGTPSLFDPADLARILAAVHAQFPGADPIAPSSTARSRSARSLCGPLKMMESPGMPFWRAFSYSKPETTSAMEPSWWKTRQMAFR